MNLKLNIELVPIPLHELSLYHYYKNTSQMNKWNKIKRDTFEKEGKKCWICGNDNLQLELHEFWRYDDENHIQRLVEMHHLCSLCHKIKHIGLWLHTQRGKENLEIEGLKEIDIINHFCKINSCSKKDFEEAEDNAFKIFRERSKYEWKQDSGEYKK